MLSPSVRSIYTSALMPPSGMQFGEAIAATYSMDPSLLLEAPVYLALLASDGGGPRRDVQCVLEAIRRHSKDITAYVQRGRMTVPSQATPLYSLLESMSVQVTSPNGGAFHPKLWLIRFVTPGGRDEMLRLVVLSRNLTHDRSWDLSLQLDGTVTGRRRSENRALAELIGHLPQWAAGEVDEHRVAQAARMADDVRRVDWELPDGLDEHVASFYAPGIEGCGWRPAPALRMAVISPFCRNRALQRLIEITDEPVALVSRSDTLCSLDPAIVDGFEHCMCLDQAAETDDGEGDLEGADRDTAGLHAKAYIFERKYYKNYTHIVMGSANATDAALVSGRNIELLVELVGRTDRIGGVDDLIGPDGLGEYLVPYSPDDQEEPDADWLAAEESVEAARELLAEANLAVRCAGTDSSGQHRLVLVGRIPELQGVRSCKAWPITVSADHAVPLVEGRDESVLSERLATASVTGLIAFELLSAHPDVTCRFVLSLPIEGVPDDREAAVLRTIISNEAGFLRYLLLLLGEDSSGIDTDGPGGGLFGRWLAALGAGDDVPLLEELTRTFSRTPERLEEVRRLIRDLAVNGESQQVIPPRFLELWDVFEQAMELRHGR